MQSSACLCTFVSSPKTNTDFSPLIVQRDHWIHLNNIRKGKISPAGAIACLGNPLSLFSLVTEHQVMLGRLESTGLNSTFPALGTQFVASEPNERAVLKGFWASPCIGNAVSL